MNEPIEFCLNKATEAEITNHFLHCDADFVPPLSGRVEISSYAHKIAGKATRFEAWADGELVGLVAVYCNDSERRAAYTTSVSVLRGWQDRGIASQLMERCVGHVKGLGFERIELEVDSENVGAVRLYEKTGFIIDRVNGRATTIHLNTGKDT